MEVVRVQLERHLCERGDRIDAVARMKLAERRAEHAVLEPAQNSVADELVQRHAAAARAAFLEHPRSEHCVGAALAQRPDEIRKTLRRVLAVAVDQRDEIEAAVRSRSGNRSSGCRRSPD